MKQALIVESFPRSQPLIGEVSNIAGRLFAVLLAASSLASASVIPTPPQDVLARPVAKFDPTPSFGPKFHFIRGPMLQIYLPIPEPNGMETVAILMFAVVFSTVLLYMIPVCQWLILRLRLMN
jgi:hypothetical protein